MRHVDDAKQSVGDRQPQRRQQQDRAQRKPHKRLPKQVSPHQTVLNVAQALGGGRTHLRIRLRLRLGKWCDFCLHVRVVGLTQQLNSLKTGLRQRTGKLEVRQRQQQGLPRHIIRFETDPFLQKTEHIWLDIPLEPPGCASPFGDTVTYELVCREGCRRQHTESVSQAYGFGSAFCRRCRPERHHFAAVPGKGMLLAVDKQAFSLQRLKQRHPCRIR